MAGRPTVSVVVLNYNGLHHLRDCFASLLKLDYPADKLELILVDNASKESPAALMALEFPTVKVVINDTNYGFARGSDIGAENATGKYVAFLNNDTKVDPGFIKYLVEAIEADPEVICAGSRILNWEGTAIDFVGAQLNFYGHGFQEAFRSEEIDKYSDKREVLFACGGAMLIDRGVFLETGGFDPDYFAFFEDVDLGWRMWLLGYKVVLEPKSIVYHKHHGTASKLQDEWKYVMYERNALFTIIKNYETDNLNRILPAALLLTVKRGLVNTGLVKKDYYLSKSVPASNLDSLIKEFQAAGVDPEPEMSVRERMARSLRDNGLFKAIFKAIARAFAVAAMYAPIFGRRKHEGVDHVGRVGMAHFVALDDVMLNMPAVYENRARLQAIRKRSDREIARLFGTPFRSNCLDPQYMAVQKTLIELFRIDEVFGEIDV